MSVNTNLVELLSYTSPYTIDGEHSMGMLARFKVGQSYGVNDNNLKSIGVQLAFTVNKNTHKSVNITVYEKYNGVVTVKENVRKNLNCGGRGLWVTVDGVKYATVELFDGTSLSRWVKGHINVLNTKEVDLKDFTSCDNVLNVPEVEKVEKVLDFTPVFYPIDEKMARLAREMNSFREYAENSTTEHYKARVKEVFEIAEENQSEKSLYLANVYAKKYAEYINNSNRIDCLCPSVMISGAGNFNIRKKEKQNARRKNLMNDYEKLQNLLEKIERTDGWGYAEIKRDTITTNEFDGIQFFKVVSNEEVNRLQLVDFEEIPTDEQKSILKHNGFKWSPRFQAWQRQLTENAISGVWRVVKEFERLENEEIEELHATIQENKTVENAEPVAEVEKAEPVQEVEKAEPVQEVDYVSKIKDITNKFDKCIDNLGEKRLMTIYVMLSQFSGNAWVKDDKARIYINNGFEFVETEKLELIKSNVWIGKNKFDWCKWNVNGFQTYDVFKHSKDDKVYCSQLAQGKIELNLYYDVLTGKFIYTDDSFKVAETVIEKIKAVVQEMKSLDNVMKTIEKAEPVEKNKLECVKSVVIDFKHNEEKPEPEPVQEVEKAEPEPVAEVEKAGPVEKPEPEPVQEVEKAEPEPVAEVEKAGPVEKPEPEPVQEVEKAEPVAEVENAETVQEVPNNKLKGVFKMFKVGQIFVAVSSTTFVKMENGVEVSEKPTHNFKVVKVSDKSVWFESVFGGATHRKKIQLNGIYDMGTYIHGYEYYHAYIDVNDEVNKQDEVVDYSTLTDNDLHDIVLSQLDDINADLIETCLNNEFMGYGKYVLVDANEFMDVTPALAEYNRRFGVDEIFCLIYSHLSNIKTHVEYDSFDDTMYIVKVEPVQDDVESVEPVAEVESVEPVAEVESVEPVAEVPKAEPVAEVEKAEPEPVQEVEKAEPVQIDINTSYPELQCYDVEDVKRTLNALYCKSID